MLLYHRRRMFIYFVLFLLIVVQPCIYLHYRSTFQCKNQIVFPIPENISDRASIVNINTRILCWIPTTLKRLDRAAVVYE